MMKKKRINPNPLEEIAKIYDTAIESGNLSVALSAQKLLLENISTVDDIINRINNLSEDDLKKMIDILSMYQKNGDDAVH